MYDLSQVVSPPSGDGNSKKAESVVTRPYLSCLGYYTARKYQTKKELKAVPASNTYDGVL